MVKNKKITFVKNQAMKIEVSNGEIADKLTIVEIKISRIKDSVKLANLNKEFEILNVANSVVVAYK